MLLNGSLESTPIPVKVGKRSCIEEEAVAARVCVQLSGNS